MGSGNSSSSLSCMSVKNKNNGPQQKYDDYQGFLEGDLLKLGRKTELFVERFYVLRDSALLCYSSSSSKIPTGKLSS